MGWLHKYKNKILDYSLFITSLLLPLILALYNGFPFYFYDTTAYIYTGFTNEILPFRPMGYGHIINIFKIFDSLWAIVIFQSIVASYLVFLFLKIFIQKNLYKIHFFIILSLLLLTSFGWFANFLMPDIFIGLGALSILIIFFEKKGWQNQIIPSFLLFVSSYVHTSHPPILLASSLIILIIANIVNKEYRQKNNIRAVIIIAIIILAFGAIKLSNREYNYTYNQAAPAFLIGRLEEIGILDDFLKKNCQNYNYQLCDLLPNFKKTRTEGFLWQKDAPINIIGWNESSGEYKLITRQVLSQPNYLFQFFFAGLKSGLNSFHLLALDPFGPHYTNRYEDYYYTIIQYFPGDKISLDSSRQFNNTNYLQKNMANLISLSFVISLVYILYLLFKRKLKNQEYIIVISIMILIAINNFMTATFSTISCSRYSNRISWLLPLMALILIVRRYFYQVPGKVKK